MAPSAWQPRSYAVFLALIALPLLVGGGELALLGGSLYYILSGGALAGVAILMWQQRREALVLYAAIIAATITWSAWEVGFNGWALMPRLVAWFVVGAWMLTPVFRRNLKTTSLSTASAEKLFKWRTLFLALMGSLLIGFMIQPLRSVEADPRFQTGIGPMPDKRLTLDLTSLSSDWEHWGNDRGGSRFSSLTQITPSNVSGLKLAWTAPLYDSEIGKKAGLSSTPLMVGNTLYTCNNVNEVFALNAETGKRLWAYNAKGISGRSCRGIAFYQRVGASGVCAQRILTATNTAKLVAIDAKSGKLCPDFGENGEINLLEGMSKAPEGYYHVTSAPAIVRGKVVFGGWVTDGQFWGEPSGVIRAFDAVTGKLSWAWDMGKPDRIGAPPKGETYTPGTPNSWAPLSADEKLGLVYLPTGNVTPDYWGGQRRDFDDRYSSSIVALDAETGRLRWSFQTTHHDVWDYDVASQPTLIDLPRKDGTLEPAVVQLTKRGEIFVLNRKTGKPLHPVTEIPAPQKDKVADDRLSPTQPISPALPSFRNPLVRETDMWGITPLDQLWCRIQFRSMRFEGAMTAPGLTKWLFSPGYVGGMNWGSGSVDPERGVIVFNSMKLATTGQLITREEANRLGMKPVGAGSNGLEISGNSPMVGTPYGMKRSPFMSPLSMPCQAPPYGYMSAVDLVTGKLIWSHPYGEAMGVTMGTPIIGGAITTRSGLVFMAGAIDKTFRALDLKTGKELWRAKLGQGGYAVPATYMSKRSGRQFVVVSDGGNLGLRSATNAQLRAYALPSGKN